MQILIYISIGVVVGLIAYGVLFGGGKVKEETKRKEILEEKQNNKKKILDFLETNEKITNNEIENMFGVSDTTTGRYLDELEKEGKIRQVGNTGAGVYYIKK